MKKTLNKILLLVLVMIMLPIQNMVVFAGTSGVSGLFKYNLYEGDTAKWVEITGYTEWPSGDIVIPYAINGAEVEKISENAFSNCGGIRSVSIPSGVSVIGANAFSECINLTKVVIKDGNANHIVDIGESAFSSCSYLKSITLPIKKSYAIRDLAFGGCNSFTDIYFKGTKEQYDACSITVYDYNDNFSNAEVYYIDSVREISLNKSSLSLIRSNSEMLLPTIIPLDASNKTVIWSSSNTNVATVSDNGLVKGVGIGTTTITAKTEDRNKIATCVVTVTENLDEVILGNGDGTASNPYKIDSEEKLQIVSDIPNAYYILENDIVLTEKFTPICALEGEFSGVFDGNGHTISNLTISDCYEYSGLFGKNSGTVKNLNVIYSTNGANFKFSTDTNFGGIAGYNNGKIINCSVDLSTYIIDNTSLEYITRIGGIAGNNDYNGEIINCKAEGQITVESQSDSDNRKQVYIGGISGINLYSIDTCNIDVSINQIVVTDGYDFVDAYIGGISGLCYGIVKNSNVIYDINVENASNAYIGGGIGIGDSYTIMGVSTDGEIISTAGVLSVGGIVGQEFGLGENSIVKSSAKITTKSSEIFGTSYIGGISGYLSESSIIQESCANIDFDISESEEFVANPIVYCGGLVGFASGKTNNCYATGTVILDTSNEYSGGLVGMQSGDTLEINNSYAVVTGVKYGLSYPGAIVSNSFYDKIVSGCSDTGCGSPTATLSMKMKTIYSNVGWDFDNVWDISPSINNGYPYLRTNDDIFGVEPLPELSVETAETSSRWYFDISKDTYTENAIIYVGIYDLNNKLLTVETADMVENDVTSISITKVNNYQYAKIFQWVNMKPVTNSKPIPLN